MIGRVIQVVPTFAPRDAIGDHAQQVDRLLREAGYDTEIYAGVAYGDLAACSRPLRQLTDSGDTGAALLLHHSTGTIAADRLRDRPEALLMDYHNITPAEMWADWEPAVAAELGWGRRQMRDLAPHTHAALADSRFNADELAGAGFRRVEVAPIVRDLGPLDRRPRTLAPRPDPEFLFVGRVSPNKGQHDLIATLALYRALFHPAARLRLIGAVASPTYRSALSRLAEDLGVAEAVTIDDNGVPEHQLLAAYDRATAFVCMSRHEGFCVPLVEAMHHALPIVALRGSAVTETVADGGLLLSGNDPLVTATAWHRVASDPTVAAQLSAAAVARGAAFDVHVTARAFLAAFERAVKDL